jgi:two-component system invasion response regulator UvrY
MIRCLIADDHAIVRQGLRHILAEHADMAEPGMAADAHETLDLVRTESWDVVVLDISMPGASGPDVLRQILTLRPSLPVLILSAHAEDQFAVRMLQAGAAGYLNKQSAVDELVEAIRHVVLGRRYVSRTLAEKLAESLDPKRAGRAPHELLSDREFQVLRLIGAGRTASEIAAQLHISVKTVSTYRSRLLEKMGMRTNAELTHYAVHAGLTD